MFLDMELDINIKNVDIAKKVAMVVEHELREVRIGCDAKVVVKQVVGKYMR